jgi:chromosome partitioning protein
MADKANVVVFASQKGGSGKTTLSGHIAVEAERNGDGPVALIDTDPQGSLAKWWNARASATPAYARVSIENLEAGIRHLEKTGFKLIVIDTPPAVTESIAGVVRFADLVVVPTRPSPHDLRAVGPTVDIVESFSKPLVFVVNSATARARITGETAIALSQHGVVAPVTVHHRTDFAASMIDGRTVGEINDGSKSADEVTKLWRYLRARFVRQGAPLADRDDAADLAVAALTPGGGAPDIFGEDEDDNLPGLGELVLPGWREEELPKPQARPDGQPEWDGVDRRKADSGPPQGVSERRQPPRAVFGRRTAFVHRIAGQG